MKNNILHTKIDLAVFLLGIAGMILAAAFWTGQANVLQNAGVVPLVIGIGGIALLLRPDLGFYLMFLLIPLDNVYVSGQGGTLTRMVGITVFVAWAIQKALKKETISSVFQNPLTMPIMAFLGWTSFSFFWSEPLAWRLAMNTYIQLALWVFMMLDFIDSQERLEKSLFFVFGGIIISCIVAILDFIRGSAGVGVDYLYYRSSGGFKDPNNFAGAIITLLPFAVYLITLKQGRFRLAGFGGLILSFVAVGVSLSRTGFIILMFTPLAFLLVWRSTQNRSKIVLVVVIASLIAIPLIPWQTLSYRFSSAAEARGGGLLGGRWELWQQGFNRFATYPLLGWGLGQTSHAYFVVHNLFLELGAQLGILGIVTMVWLWVVAWKNVAKSRRIVQLLHDKNKWGLTYVVMLSLLFHLIYSFTVSNQSTRFLWLMLTLPVVWYRIVEKQPIPVEDPPAILPAAKHGQILR